MNARWGPRSVAFEAERAKAMWTLVAFLVERLLVSLPDILLAGGGAFLTASRGWRRIVGITLLVIYSMSTAGQFLSESPPRLDPDDLKSVGITFGAIAAIGGWLLGRRFRRRSECLSHDPCAS
jgi:hypothetical protein